MVELGRGGGGDKNSNHDLQFIASELGLTRKGALCLRMKFEGAVTEICAVPELIKRLHAHVCGVRFAGGVIVNLTSVCFCSGVDCGSILITADAMTLPSTCRTRALPHSMPGHWTWAHDHQTLP